LKAAPSRGLPQDLAEQEASTDHDQCRDRIQSELSDRAPNEDAPLLTFLKSGNGLLQLEMPQLDGMCLLAFSSPLRAADYASEAAPERKFEYFCSSARQAALVVAEFFQYANVRHVALDRCPRCNIFTTIAASSLNSATSIIQTYIIFKATEVARCNLYWNYARTAARNGHHLCARDVALELVGHVTAEDARTHLLLGKLAIQLNDKRLLREAKDFLAVLRETWAIEELRQAEKTRAFEF
jgi:hypothetical protein